MARPSTSARWLLAGTIAGLTLGSVGVAFGQTDESTTTTAPPASSSTAPAAPASPEERPERGDKTPLTGADAEKAKAAALAAVPGATIGRAWSDAEGYGVHLTRPDGTHATVRLDGNFAVVRIEEGGKRCGHGGPRGPRGAEVTGEAADKAEAAALAAVPGATVDRVVEGRDGGYVALLTKADGTRVAVKLDDAFAVTSVEDKVGRGPGRHRHGPPPGDAPAGDSGSSESSGTTGTATNV